MIKKSLSSISIYTLTSLICAVLSMCVLPVFTTYLSQKDYGVSSIISSYVMIISPILGLSAGGFFWLEFFKKKTNLNIVFSTYFWFLLFSLIFFILLFFVLFPFIKHFLDFSLLFLLIIPLLSYFIEIGDFSKALFINKKKPFSYLIYSVLFTIIELYLSYLFIKYIFRSWEGRIFAWLLVLTLQFIVSLIIFGGIEKYLTFTFDKKILYNIFLFGFPLIFHQIGKFVINQSDRIFISKMVSIDEAGIYSLGYQVGSMILLPIGAFFNFYTPFLYERLAELNEHKKREIVKMSYLIFSLTILCFLFINILSPYFFQFLIDPKFHSGNRYVFWVSLSYVFWCMYLFFSGVLFYYKKTTFLGLISIINVISNMVLNYLFIIKFGPIGAAYATAVSFFVVFILVCVRSHKILKLPWFKKV